MSLWDIEGMAERVTARYLAGEAPAEIARSLGVSRNMINAKLDRMNVLRRRGAAQPRAHHVAPARKPAPAPKPEKVRAQPSKPRAICTVEPRAQARVFGPTKVTPLYSGNPHTSPVQKKLDAIKATLTCEPLPEVKGELTPTCDLAGLGSDMCKWPIGDPAREGFGFCGRDAEGPYCGPHILRAYQPAEAKKRSSAAELARSLRRYM